MHGKVRVMEADREDSEAGRGGEVDLVPREGVDVVLVSPVGVFPGLAQAELM